VRLRINIEIRRRRGSRRRGRRRRRRGRRRHYNQLIILIDLRVHAKLQVLTPEL
jgi:hypothetical protein